MNCATCGGSLVAGARFCSQCGAAISAVAASEKDQLRSALETALGTHYQIIRELGRGGMGAVYLAHEKGLDRDVAIKVLPPDRAESEFYRDRFRLEARAAARLNHANIVPLHTFGEHDGMLYYVMGYVDGESLADRLERDGHVDETEARRILTALGGALHYAHGRGVLHRDVKPHNILIEQGSNRALLTDFGISKVISDSTQTVTGMVLGTPDYMSPEQASGSPDIDGRSDLYSLGLVGYAMLSGRLPFQGRTPGESIAKRLVEDAPRLNARDSNISAELIDTIMKSLARDPRERWSDCEAFGRALSQEDFDDRGQFDSVGLLAMVLAYAGVVAFMIWQRSTAPRIAIELIGKITPLVGALVVVLAIGAAVSLKRQGYGALQICQTIFKEPESWSGWYPPALRRRGNIWDRLPGDVKMLRAWLSATIVIVGIAIGPLAFSALTGASTPNKPVNVAVASAIIFMLGTFLFLAWFIPWRLLRKGVSAREAGGMAYLVPPSKKAFWSRPSVAPFLNSASRSQLIAAEAETKTVTRQGH